MDIRLERAKKRKQFMPINPHEAKHMISRTFDETNPVPRLPLIIASKRE